MVKRLDLFCPPDRFRRTDSKISSDVCAVQNILFTDGTGAVRLQKRFVDQVEANGVQTLAGCHPMSVSPAAKLGIPPRSDSHLSPVLRPHAANSRSKLIFRLWTPTVGSCAVKKPPNGRFMLLHSNCGLRALTAVGLLVPRS